MPPRCETHTYVAANDKIILEKVQRQAAKYVKGDYSYAACVTDMPNDLKWESLESRREKFSLIMLYHILRQNTYLPLDYLPEFHSIISVPTTI